MVLLKLVVSSLVIMGVGFLSSRSLLICNSSKETSRLKMARALTMGAALASITMVLIGTESVGTKI